MLKNRDTANSGAAYAEVSPLIEELIGSNQPVTFCINGKWEFTVRDDGSRRRLAELIERIEEVAKIQEGFDSVNRGESRPLEDFIAEKNQQHGL
jgi:hypothetical protein